MYPIMFASGKAVKFVPFPRCLAALRNAFQTLSTLFAGTPNVYHAFIDS